MKINLCSDIRKEEVMKKAFVFLAVSLVAVFAMGTTAFATTYDGCWVVWENGTAASGWWSNSLVYNVSGASVTVEALFIDTDGDMAYYTASNIPAGECWNRGDITYGDLTNPESAFDSALNHLIVYRTEYVNNIMVLGVAGSATEGFNAYSCMVRDYSESGYQSTVCPVTYASGWWCGHIVIILPATVFDTNASVGWGSTPGNMLLTYCEDGGGTATYTFSSTQTGLNNPKTTADGGNWTNGDPAPGFDTNGFIRATLNAETGYVVLSFAFWGNNTLGFLARGISCAKED